MRRADALLKLILSILIVLVGLATTYQPVIAASTMNRVAALSKFSDVRPDHYAYEAIQWAQERGIVKGYGDGRFGPNEPVTEAHFAKMVSEFFGLTGKGEALSKGGQKPVWSDDYYNTLASYAAPLNGYFDNAIRNQTVKRGVVAQVLANLSGYRMNLTESIEFLLENEVSTGQNGGDSTNILHYFGAANDLSRAQVVTFLYRMEQNGLSQIGPHAQVTYRNDDGRQLSQLASLGKGRVDDSLKKETTIVNPIITPVKTLADSYNEKTKKRLSQLPDWLPYDKNRKESSYSSLNVYNQYFPKFDSKTIQILKNHDATVYTMIDYVFSIETKNDGKISISVYTDDLNKGNYYAITYDTFTNDEIIQIIGNVSGLKIPSADLEKAKKGKEFIYQANGKYYSIWGRDDGILFVVEKKEKIYPSPF